MFLHWNHWNVAFSQLVRGVEQKLKENLNIQYNLDDNVVFVLFV